MKTVLRAFCIAGLLLVLAGASANAGQVIRFDFQVNMGENAQELYRLDVDLLLKKGELCVLNTARSNVPPELVAQTRRGVPWASVMDMQKYTPSCAALEIYDPVGWFYTYPIVSQGREVRMVFIGDISKKTIAGKLYQFIQTTDGPTQYRSCEEINLNARAVGAK